MSRNVYRLSFFILLALALGPVLPASADTTAAISFAEQPVRLLRETGFYQAARGARLQSGDIVDSGASGLQLDCGAACIMALGPDTQVALRFGPRGFDVVVLNGWMKIQSRPAPGSGSVTVSSKGLQLNAAGSSVIVHARPGVAELFVETGEPFVDEMQGAKVVQHTKFTREQYALRAESQPLKLLPRPPKEFISGMPKPFLDVLVPVPIKGAPQAAKRERAATFSEVTPWLADEPALRQAIDRRFNPPKPKPRFAPPAPGRVPEPTLQQPANPTSLNL